MSRSLWFEPRLFNDRAGRQARADLEQLGDAAQHHVLAVGDRLSAVSAVVAQQVYRRSASIWHRLGVRGYDQWVHLGEQFLEPNQPNRDAAVAYFGLTTDVVEQAGFERLREWCGLGREIGTRGRKLGAAYIEGTAALLPKLDLPVLHRWAEQGLRVLGINGWKGEFLARALFASGPKVLAFLGVDEIATWVDLGLALEPAFKQGHFFDSIPTGLPRLSSEERSLVLRGACAMAASDAPAARSFIEQIGTAVRRVQAPSRARLLEALITSGATIPKAVAEVAPVCGVLLHDIPRSQRPTALDLLFKVATRFPRGTVALLRSLPVAHEDVAPPAVIEWVERGLEVAAENSDAGVAYFGLESRTSRQVLHASSTAAQLSDVQNVLRKYIQMLSAEAVSIRAAETAQIRAPIEEFPLEQEVALPLKVDRFRTHEDNCQLYRVLAAQVAGRRLFGTYDARVPDGVNGLFDYLRDPDKPELLEDLFLVAEGVRVSTALARAYQGLAQLQRDVAVRLLAALDARYVPPQAALLDYVLLWLWSQHRSADAPVWLKPVLAVIGPCVQPLMLPTATVDDSLSVAEHLVSALEWDVRSRREADLTELAYERMVGESVLDMYVDEGEAPPVAGPAGAGPELPKKEEGELDAKLELEPERDDSEGGAPMSAEELQKLLDSGADLKLSQGQADGLDGLGLYISDLLGKLPQDSIDQLRSMLGETGRERTAPKRWIERRSNGAAFYYDEWDYHIQDYRERWCRLLEILVDSDSGEFFNQTLSNYSDVIPEIRRQFQRIRPETYRVVRGLEDGEDFDLNAVIDARVDRRANKSPSPRLYVARQREERDVATLFLIDMSASTDEPIASPPKGSVAGDDPLAALVEPSKQAKGKPRRIIDLTKEALVVMAAALEEIGDAYAIYGFSGHGRSNVEFYLVKSFNEALSTSVKGRIGALEPKRSTRMGAALRHAIEKMASVSARSRHVILLSDGFPQDFDYGQDRRSNVYGLRDTTIALREAEAAGIVPFCITVDKAGHDYLREMCDESRYMVIDDIASLPQELPKIYQRVVSA